MPNSTAQIDSGNTVLDVVSFEVEAGKVREFARATHAADPVHTDADAAHDAGLTAVAATPTHVVVAGHHRDQRRFVENLGLAIERVVVGSVEWEYARPLLVGDRLTGTRRIVDDATREGKRGGTMRLVTLETAWVDAAGDVAVTQREVLIERGA
ncbi:MaoC family dehydratase N-terminal domain-containing protein [Gordonia sp. NB41Y]|uniref:FAS1-like dehydratase domain-containing protein n=1 Tax=Gordonia sp. NB41Y TaxID=875808 RepID=UPI0002BFD989|nr:MaoC family dehydratase N-terminal domain-containing protein [Gordonia sp. NB41Y]EMP12239.1 acyl dehydratase [Gordonia sp. NB41Y]WLP89015.1 MaoC family dehydratase N-terminal domain-containing protein [Gordonia sp. NB41Y]